MIGFKEYKRRFYVKILRRASRRLKFSGVFFDNKLVHRAVETLLQYWHHGSLHLGWLK